jgi:hypothetical protein
MFKKLKRAAIKADIRIRNAMHRIINEEKGGTEIVAILLIIIVLIGIVVIFRNQLSKLITDFFERITNDVNNDL